MIGESNVTQLYLHIFIFILFIFILLLFKQRLRYFNVLKYFIGYFILCIFYFIIVSLINSVSLSYRDFTDLLRPAPYLMYFILPFIFPISLNEYHRFFKIGLVILIFQFVFSTLVYVPFMYPLVDLFKGRDSEDFVLFHFFRWSGLMGYPSDFTFYLSLYFYYFLLCFLYNYKKMFSIFILIIVSICFVFSLSRGGVLSVIFTCFIFVLFAKGYIKLRFFKLIVTFLFFIFFISLFVNLTLESSTEFKFDYFVNIFDSSEKIDDSAQHRLNELNLALEMSNKYFPFGGGSNREMLKNKINVIESYYGYLLIKWGVFGLLLNFLFLFFVIKAGFFSFKYFRSLNDVQSYILTLSIVLFIGSVPLVFGFSSDMTSRLKCLPLFYFSCGFLVYLKCLIKFDFQTIYLNKNNL